MGGALVCSATRCVALEARSLITVALAIALSLFSKPPRAAPSQVYKVVEEIQGESKPPVKKDSRFPQVIKEESRKEEKEEEEEEDESLKKEEEVGIIIREARDHLGVDCIKYYNFAVTGQTGVGKSSFVNAILSLQEGNAASAPVGEVETTEEIRSYSCEKWPSLKLWDIPGAGTRKHPADTYFQDKKLYLFDAILILTADRFLEVDFHILRSARKFKTPCVFVRTKCDIAVESRAKRDKVNAMEASQRVRADVSRSFREGLANTGCLNIAAGASSSESCTPHLYFISNKFLSDGDAYSIYDKKAKSFDCSLSSMDEHALITFLLDAAKIRA